MKKKQLQTKQPSHKYRAGGTACSLPASLVVHVSQDAPVLEIWRNDNASAILFYPGSMLEPGHYRTLVAALWQAGLTVAGIHLSGHGHCRGDNDFTFSRLLGQGLIAESWLLGNGFGQVAVLGHSQGGILALAHAAASKTLKAAFAISAAYPEMPEAIHLTRFAPYANQRQKIIAFLERLAALLPFLPVPLPAYLELGKIMAGVKKPVYMGTGQGRIAYPLKFLVSLFTARPANRLNCPFWLFNARNDALFTADLTEKTFRLTEAPYKELVWFEDGGHMAPLNPDIARFAAGHVATAAAWLGMRLNTYKKAD